MDFERGNLSLLLPNLLYNLFFIKGIAVKKLEVNQVEIEAFGGRVRELRKALKATQKDFAESLRMSGSYLSEIERGHASPGFEFFLNLTTAYNVGLDYLVRGEGEMFRADSVKNEEESGEFPSGIESLKDLSWFLNRSSLFKNSIMGMAQRFYYESEKTIKKNIDQLKKDRKKDKKASTGAG